MPQAKGAAQAYWSALAQLAAWEDSPATVALAALVHALPLDATPMPSSPPSEGGASSPISTTAADEQDTPPAAVHLPPRRESGPLGARRSLALDGAQVTPVLPPSVIPEVPPSLQPSTCTLYPPLRDLVGDGNLSHLIDLHSCHQGPTEWYFCDGPPAFGSRGVSTHPTDTEPPRDTEEVAMCCSKQVEEQGGMQQWRAMVDAASGGAAVYFRRHQDASAMQVAHEQAQEVEAAIAAAQQAAVHATLHALAPVLNPGLHPQPVTVAYFRRHQDTLAMQAAHKRVQEAEVRAAMDRAAAAIERAANAKAKAQAAQERVAALEALKAASKAKRSEVHVPSREPRRQLDRWQPTGLDLFEHSVHSALGEAAAAFRGRRLKAKIHLQWRTLGCADRRYFEDRALAYSVRPGDAVLESAAARVATFAISLAQSRAATSADAPTQPSLPAASMRVVPQEGRSRRGARPGHVQGGDTGRPTSPLGEG